MGFYSLGWKYGPISPRWSNSSESLCWSITIISEWVTLLLPLLTAVLTNTAFRVIIVKCDSDHQSSALNSTILSLLIWIKSQTLIPTSMSFRGLAPDYPIADHFSCHSWSFILSLTQLQLHVFCGTSYLPVTLSLALTLPSFFTFLPDVHRTLPYLLQDFLSCYLLSEIS